MRTHQLDTRSVGNIILGKEGHFRDPSDKLRLLSLRKGATDSEIFRGHQRLTVKIHGINDTNRGDCHNAVTIKSYAVEPIHRLSRHRTAIKLEVIGEGQRIACLDYTASLGRLRIGEQT